MNLVTPKAASQHELLFNKPTSTLSSTSGLYYSIVMITTLTIVNYSFNIVIYAPNKSKGYDRNMLIVQAAFLTIINYDCNTFTVIA